MQSGIRGCFPTRMYITNGPTSIMMVKGYADYNSIVVYDNDDRNKGDDNNDEDYDGECGYDHHDDDYNDDYISIWRLLFTVEGCSIR